MRSPPAADANEMPAPPSSGVPKLWAFKKDSRRRSLEANSMSQTRAPAGVDGCEVGIMIWKKVLGLTPNSIEHKQAAEQGKTGQDRTGKGKGPQQGQRFVPMSSVRIWVSSKGFRNVQRRDTWRNVERIPHPDVAQRVLTWLGQKRCHQKAVQECRSEMSASLMMPDASYPLISRVRSLPMWLLGGSISPCE
ncbi:hypothetical protein CEP54_015536 [Fusarium duplospermum]|uniref:Uncharacterized protein n=1 Tax=Fusarium duplospermum TaxID=1325734 RepID=A0A428NNE9_9HYPO|nr:hypothetical protein CEP54_015536 [Fusarium duplospermum]